MHRPPLSACALLVVPLFHAAAGAATVRASAADALVDHIGVNIHVHYTDTIYSDAAKLKAALQALGVRHVRDGLVDAQWQPYFDRHNDHARAGIRCTFIVSSPMDRVLPLAAKVRDAVEAFEGPNEVNLNQWTVERAAQYQKDLWATIRADATWADRPILALSVTDYAYGARLGDLSAFADFGNIHPYPGGWEPENRNDWMKADLPSGLSGARLFTGAKPVIITETGYTTHQGQQGHMSVTPAIHGAYLPRLLLHTFGSGVRRTFLYELFDLKDDPKDQEANFGLIRTDGTTFKPAGIALRNLTALFADPGPAFAPGELAFTVSEPAVRTALFQKRDGAYLLAAWTPTSMWDQSRPYGQKQQVDPEDTPCTITLGRPAKAVTLITGLDTEVVEKPLPAGASIAFTASERVAVLRIVF